MKPFHMGPGLHAAVQAWIYLGSWVRARWPCSGSLGLAGLMTGLCASSVNFPSQSFRSVTRMKRMSARTFSSRNLAHRPKHQCLPVAALMELPTIR